MARFSCHGSLRGSHVPSWGFLENNPKNNAPQGERLGFAVFCSFFNYIAHFSPKSKPYGDAKAQNRAFLHYIFVTPG
jgi:hypothetical protein